MGLQLLIEAPGEADLEAALGQMASDCEIFPAGRGHFGMSVPSNVLDAAGEDAVRKSLSRFRRYDLWEGKWHEPRKKWRL